MSVDFKQIRPPVIDTRQSSHISAMQELCAFEMAASEIPMAEVTEVAKCLEAMGATELHEAAAHERRQGGGDFQKDPKVLKRGQSQLATKLLTLWSQGKLSATCIQELAHLTTLEDENPELKHLAKSGNFGQVPGNVARDVTSGGRAPVPDIKLDVFWLKLGYSNVKFHRKQQRKDHPRFLNRNGRKQSHQEGCHVPQQDNEEPYLAE